MTLAEKFKLAHGRPSGFDYMRIALAISVIAMHGALTTAGQQADFALWTTPLRPFLRAIVPMFFTLSGFLVAGSLERCQTLLAFIGLRAIRIYPALIVEVLLSAFLIGACITSSPPKAYFHGAEFRDYLFNAIGDIHYYLPGVFEDNPFPRIVNAQLWTVPYELGCYVTLAALALVGIKRRPILAPAATVGMAFGYFALRLLKHHGEYPFILGGVPGALLIVAFLAGLSLYLYRDRVPCDRRLFLGAAGGALLCLWIVPAGEALGVLLLGYVTIWLGLLNTRRLWFIRSADFSYGVYLYGFVIQQLFSYLFPALRFWWASILVCVPCALIVAAVSWSLVEKPALRLKGPLMKFEAKWIAARELAAVARVTEKV
jgi:peptidoglycan/LPS O-acetylase OafA/YrhL